MRTLILALPVLLLSGCGGAVMFASGAADSVKYVLNRIDQSREEERQRAQGGYVPAIAPPTQPPAVLSPSVRSPQAGSRPAAPIPLTAPTLSVTKGEALN